MIQRAFRCTHAGTHTNKLIEQPAPSLTCPAEFPIGCCIIVASSHPTHASKEGTVCKLTKKFVLFTPNENSTNIIHILPKSLAAYHPNGKRKINSTEDDDEHNPGQTEREHTMYDQLNETQIFPVADGFVSLTRTFQYLGSLISYNLRDDDDITSRLATANASMGALTEVWHDPHLDVYNKYLLF